MLFGRCQKNPIKIADKGVVEWKYAACGYCSTGCSIEVGVTADGKPVSSRGVAEADVNRGKLCLKGIFEHELFRTPGRGRTPLMRDKVHEEFDIKLQCDYYRISTGDFPEVKKMVLLMGVVMAMQP